MIKSCETCIYGNMLCEHNTDGTLIPESVYYLCKLDDKEYSDRGTPINCKYYKTTLFFETYMDWRD